MDDAPLMGVVDAIADFLEETQPQLEFRGIVGLWPPLQPVVESLTQDHLHREEFVTLLGVVSGNDARDGWVIETLQRLGFASEHATMGFINPVVVAYDLERDSILRTLVFGLPHHTHGSLAEHSDEPVARDGFALERRLPIRPDWG